MKQFRFLTMAALIAFGTAVCAQNVITLDEMQARKKQQQQQPQQQQVVQEKASYSSGSDVQGFGTLFVQYSPSSLKSKEHDVSVSQSVNVLSLGYTYAQPLGGIPLYLEFGAAAQWYFKYKTEDGAKDKFNMIAIKIPVNVMYSFDISDAFSIMPYAGVYGRVNILAKEKVTYDGETIEDVDYFDKDKQGDFAWKRFQLGFDAGCKFRFAQKFAVGVGYYMDLMKVMSYKKHKSNFQGFDISLGFTF